MDTNDIAKVNQPEYTRGVLVLKVAACLEAQRKEMFYAHERERLCVDLVCACEGEASDAVVASIARDYIRTKKEHMYHRNRFAVKQQDASDAWLLWSGSPVDPARHEYMLAVARAVDDLREKKADKELTDKEPGKETP